MKTTPKFALSLVIALTGALPPSIGLGAELEPSPSATIMSRLDVQEGQFYMTTRQLFLPILERDGVVVSKSEMLILAPDTDLVILEKSADGRTFRIGMDDVDGANSDLTVDVSTLNDEVFASVDANFTEKDIENEEFAEILESHMLARKKKKQSGRKRTEGMTYCYGQVKETLQRKRLCNRYASGVFASEGFNILQRECGMRVLCTGNNCKNTARMAVNTVCVSGGGRVSGCPQSGCGHIAIKTNASNWYGAGNQGSPWLENSKSTKKRRYIPRYIIGCLIPR